MEDAGDQVQEPSTQASASNTATRPVVSFSGTGGLNVAVWKNKAENDREHCNECLASAIDWAPTGWFAAG